MSNGTNAVRSWIDADAIRADAEARFAPSGRREHAKVLQDILNDLEPVDFRERGGLGSEEQISQKIQIVVTIEAVLAKARELNCGLCRNQDFIYAYNGEYWQLIEKGAIENFLGEAAQRIGVDAITARYHKTKKELLHQFLADAYLSPPVAVNNLVLINLRNGTFEVTKDGFSLREFRQSDFMSYQLPFEYRPGAGCSGWRKFLNEVLPDESRQTILAEYFGYVFARHLKLEKTLLLYGTGANGKSVVFEVVNALLGSDNVSNVSLESISKDQHYRAMLAHKLLNYSPEISNRLQADKFKQLTSGEPIEARLPYGQPMILKDYARLAFNCNDLPKDVEHSEAFFRRFLIILFGETIPQESRNPNLAKEIITMELSGVFNWILDGLMRLLNQDGFSECDAAKEMLETFRRESDSVAMFIEDEEYVNSTDRPVRLQDLYRNYKSYCQDNGNHAVSSKTLIKRLEAQGYATAKKSSGKVIFIARKTSY